MRKKNRNITAVQRRLEKKVQEERLQQRIKEYKKQLEERDQLEEEVFVLGCLV